jgi:iron complex transport system ATP-binding protein
MTTAELKSVSFKAHQALLLDNIDVQFHSGETVAIIGPNGAGKSTLMRILSGDIRPSSGRVIFQNDDLASYHPRDLATRRAILSQHVHVSFPFTVEEVVRMGAPHHRQADVSRLLDALLDEVEMSGLRNRDFPTLSGGEQQRAHFARALLQLTLGEEKNGPGLLLLDEPTSSLDLRHQIKLIDSAKERARRGTTVIAVLHDINSAVRLSGRVLVLKKGRVVGDGNTVTQITADMMAEVFAISARVHRTSFNQPYVLPQEMESTLL